VARQIAGKLIENAAQMIAASAKGSALAKGEDQGLDKTGTTGVLGNVSGSQEPIFKALASRGSFSTEREGFEPSRKSQ
jgi:hypothetical protein